MFGNVRRNFGDTWRGLRERGTVRLFAFEFVVVLLGVLAAQALANWAGERERNAQADKGIARMQLELAQARDSVAIWQVAVPCLRGQAISIIRDARTGGTIDPALLRRPLLYRSNFTDLGEEAAFRAREQLGDGWLTAATDTGNQVRQIDQYITAIGQNWYQFVRLDPASGPVEASDASDARHAAAEILGALRGIEIAVDLIDAHLDDMQVSGSRPADPLTRRWRPARDCREIAEKNAITFLVEPGA